MLGFYCFDLLMAMEESRKHNYILKTFNVTNIILIPKSLTPRSFANFRPISLCNIVHKIFTKAIYLILQKLLLSIISPQQGGFIPAKEMMDGALLSHEVLHSINTHQSPLFVVKLDMMEVCDKVNWNFLTKVLLKFIFSPKWCKWIKAFFFWCFVLNDHQQSLIGFIFSHTRS